MLHVFFADLVLRGAWKRAVGFVVPDRVRVRGRVGRRVHGAFESVDILLDAAATDVLEVHDEVEFVEGDPALVVNVAARIRQRQRFGAELQELLDGVLRDVAAARHETRLALQRLVARRQHLGGEIDGAIAGRFRTNERAAPVQPFPGQHTGELVPDPLVLAEEIADFTPADADVARRDVGVRTDVATELRHEALTEPHHLVVALPFRIEIRSTFAAAHRQRRQRILEHLLEGEELEDAEVHRRMESQAAFVRADGAVHLDPVAPIDLVRAAIVLPRHAEHHDALGFDHALDDPRVAILGTPLEHQIQRFDNFLHGLVKLGLARVLRSHVRHQVAHEARPLHVGRRHKGVSSRKR